MNKVALSRIALSILLIGASSEAMAAPVVASTKTPILTGCWELAIVIEAKTDVTQPVPILNPPVNFNPAYILFKAVGGSPSRYSGQYYSGGVPAPLGVTGGSNYWQADVFRSSETSVTFVPMVDMGKSEFNVNPTKGSAYESVYAGILNPDGSITGTWIDMRGLLLESDKIDDGKGGKKFGFVDGAPVTGPNGTIIFPIQTGHYRMVRRGSVGATTCPPPAQPAR